MLTGGHWIAVKDGDARARALYRRHYSCYHYRDGRRPMLFVGPGEKMVLLTEDSRAVWVWRKFISADGQEGICNALFRNEGPLTSSQLIAEACRLAWRRWPGERLYTYVDPAAVLSEKPGTCFVAAGWSFVLRPDGEPVRTKRRGRLIMERLPRRRKVRPSRGGSPALELEVA